MTSRLYRFIYAYSGYLKATLNGKKIKLWKRKYTKKPL